MTKIKILISDKMSEAVCDVFAKNDIEAHYKPDTSKEELLGIVGDYDALIVRSRTKVSKKVISQAKELKIIARSGIGVDNIDVEAASEAGIIVMNAPYGNSITTAEHAIAMMMALARQIPVANQSTQQGKWEKNRFMGTELFNKNIGIIGCGNIGSIVASRALGLKMKVWAYDPFLSDAKAEELGVIKIDFHELMKNCDFITLHTPQTEKTRNIINAESLALCKKGAYIINCARGGLIDEKALIDALDNGRIAGVALDVFPKEPATQSPFFGRDNVICTPHLGAATAEAQKKVAVQIAQQVTAYFQTGQIQNAINSPNISAKEIAKIKPFANTANLLGQFCGQMIRSSLKNITISYHGKASQLDHQNITAAILKGILSPILHHINDINAIHVAKQRGIQIKESFSDNAGVYESYIMLIINTENHTRKIAGTVFSDKLPRIINVDNVNMEAVFSTNMLYINNVDRPGFIGALGTVLGNFDINIARFNLGRTKETGDAIALVAIDAKINQAQINEIRKIKHVKRVEFLNFPAYRAS